MSVTIKTTKISLNFSVFLILPLSTFDVPNFAICIQNCIFFQKKLIFFTKTIDLKIKNIPFNSSRHGLSTDIFFKWIRACLIYFFFVKRKKVHLIRACSCWKELSDDIKFIVICFSQGSTHKLIFDNSMYFVYKWQN